MKERLLKILNNPIRKPVSVGLVSFGAGVGLGYVLWHRRKFQLHAVPTQGGYDADAMEAFLEKEEAKHGIVRPEKPVEEMPFKTFEESSSPTPDLLPGVSVYTSDAVEENEVLIVADVKDEISKGEAFVAGKLVDEVVGDEPEPEMVTRTIFEEEDDDWDFEKELAGRSRLAPFVIHKDEFYGEEAGYSQTTFTYYAGDNIMVDEEDTPVYNHDMVVGPLLFGHGSGDPNVFYVRNDKQKAEHEIIRDQGLYSVEILGLEIENNERVKGLRHAGTRKFKME